ncbi:MAG TPA: SHOCT domain-containing protein [Actinomycetota bacterium]|nr:SHOCT domain-containing protein [Actinomycetota bacterium]
MLLAAAPVLADHMHHDHGGWWPIFPIFWILLFVGLFWLARRRGACRPHRHYGSGESVLAERYARGEITENEYRERREVLRGPRKK